MDFSFAGLRNGKTKEEKPDAKLATAAEDVSSESGSTVRGMSGFDGLGAVKEAARKSPITDVKRSTRVTAKQQQQTDADRAAEERKQKALETVGKYNLQKLAALPYEIWAMFAADESLKLNKDEQKELADAYYLLAQGMDIDFSKPLYVAIGILLAHAAIIGTRLKALADKAEAEQAQVETGAKPN